MFNHFHSNVNDYVNALGSVIKHDPLRRNLLKLAIGVFFVTVAQLVSEIHGFKDYFTFMLPTV